MNAHDITLEELIDFSEGLISLKGRRLLLHDIHAFAHLRKDLVNMVGLDMTRQTMTRFGYFWGHADAAAVKRIVNMDSMTEWLKAGARMNTLHGVAKSIVNKIDINEKTGSFYMEVQFYQSAEADEHLIGLGKTDHPVCWMIAGYLTGYATFCFGQNIFFLENQCIGKGDHICTAVGKDEKSWGEEIKPHLRFFQGEDVKSKIIILSEELKKKNLELLRNRRKISRLERIKKPFYVEVKSKAFMDVIDLANRIAPFDSSVLITGETGVGKEVLARYIHSMSHRNEKSFLAINCGALPETLAESELFGHKAGSFTGAIHDRVGLFEQASKGTIFLDEIGDVTQSIQIKILRVLQEREIMRVGESFSRKVDVRIIAATNKNLEQAIADEEFRDDLYYRLSVIEIHIPPLRQRKEDILPLARYFVKRMSHKLKMPNLKLDPSCLQFLFGYQWPGNVRELENVIERASILSVNGIITPDNLPSQIINTTQLPKHLTDPLHCTLEQAEKEHIINVMNLVDGNKTKASQILGISPTTLWRKLNSIDLTGKELSGKD